ncbi:MAG: hypothetical protein PSX42_15800 [bacterium]|nr:hypothetical protein [bacterium]
MNKLKYKKHRVDKYNRELNIFLNAKERRDLRRKQLFKIKKGEFVFDNIIYKPIHLEYLQNKVEYLTKHKSRIPGDGRLRLPKIFSLTENPSDSFQFLRNLLATMTNPKNKEIVIDYHMCEKISLDASVCMDIILREKISFLKELDNKSKHHKIQSIRGEKLNNIEIRKFVNSTGTNHIINGISYDYPDVITYDLCQGDKKEGAGKKEIEITKLMMHVEKCLSRMGKKLNHKAKRDISTIIGEVLTNAEDHSTMDHRFSIGHFQESNEDNHHIGMFQLVILNFGKTIYEKLKDPKLCKNQKIVERMKRLSSLFTKKGFLRSAAFQEETLWTLYALQEGVSSIDIKRGNGTIRFIDSFFNLKGPGIDYVSTLTILSGNTKIIFDGKYEIKEVIRDDDKFKVLTFNESDSLEEKPDEKYVQHTENYFPGTLIYTNICIKEDNIVI